MREMWRPCPPAGVYASVSLSPVERAAPTPPLSTSRSRLPLPAAAAGWRATRGWGVPSRRAPSSSTRRPARHDHAARARTLCLLRRRRLLRLSSMLAAPVGRASLPPSLHAPLPSPSPSTARVCAAPVSHRPAGGLCLLPGSAPLYLCPPPQARSLLARCARVVLACVGAETAGEPASACRPARLPHRPSWPVPTARPHLQADTPRVPRRNGGGLAAPRPAHLRPVATADAGCLLLGSASASAACSF